ncbi:hypothetical protein R69658_07280 [Paraburkholderia aspalathi]|uniref:Polysaccharide deacetylase n=2 Tax=Paraburkholderia aspalathi TaxID=1324617 RepID=A0ABN7NBV6_9BURK|nr:hypothetical protein R69658_07280 [Paraburkholderia aspalathi]
MVSNCAAALQALDDELYVWSRMRRRPCFWWRDDDAYHDSLALQSLRKLLETQFLFLAVIPGLLSVDLVRMIEPGAPVRVLQHGWAHTNHAASGENPSEFPPHRPLGAIERELRAGQAILSGAFPGIFHRVFVPPWHRCANWILRDAVRLGFEGISLQSPLFPLLKRGYPGETNIDIDLCDWTCNGAFIGTERLAVLLVRALKLRRDWQQQDTPVGILSHHALLTAADFGSLSVFLQLLRCHNADWTETQTLFP